MAKFSAVRMQVSWKFDPTSVWAAETSSNTLHMGLKAGDDAESVSAGPWTIPEHDCTDEGGTFTHAVPSAGTFNVERGWAIQGATDVDGWFKAVLNAWGQFYGTAGPYQAGVANLDSIRLYPLNNEGKMASLAPMIARPTAVLSQAGKDTHSPDLAVCISLYTALRTKRGRGRWYFGPLNGAISMTGDGLLSTAPITAIGNGMKLFLDGLRAAKTGAEDIGDMTSTPVVLHRDEPFNQAAVIQKVRVGDELDRQERRTKSRDELFTDFALTV